MDVYRDVRRISKVQGGNLPNLSRLILAGVLTFMDGLYIRGSNILRKRGVDVGSLKQLPCRGIFSLSPPHYIKKHKSLNFKMVHFEGVGRGMYDYRTKLPQWQKKQLLRVRRVMCI